MRRILIDRARPRLSLKRGGNHADRLSMALDRLIELYTATNMPDEAKEYQAERAKRCGGKERVKGASNYGAV